MSFEGYFTEHDDVLENKLGITDPEELKTIESEIVAIRMSEVLAKPPKGELDFQYLKRIHRKLFSDIYTMAGKIRTVDIAKGGSVFCYVRFLDDEQQRIFGTMKTLFSNRDIPKESFVESLSVLSADLNALHPFREGNGRAIRTFLIILCMRHHYHLDFGKAETDRIMNADISAFHGDLTLLKQLYMEILDQE